MMVQEAGWSHQAAIAEAGGLGYSFGGERYPQQLAGQMGVPWTQQVHTRYTAIVLFQWLKGQLSEL